jgi:hypothetical protein
MRSEQPFSPWHVLATIFALSICLQTMAGAGQYLRSAGAIWEAGAAGGVLVLLGAAAMYLVGQVLAEFGRRGKSQRRMKAALPQSREEPSTQ